MCRTNMRISTRRNGPFRIEKRIERMGPVNVLAVEQTQELVGAQGVFNMTPQNHNGMDTRSRVMMTVKNGRWTLAQ